MYPLFSLFVWRRDHAAEGLICSDTGKAPNISDGPSPRGAMLTCYYFQLTLCFLEQNDFQRLLPADLRSSKVSVARVECGRHTRSRTAHDTASRPRSPQPPLRRRPTKLFYLAAFSQSRGAWPPHSPLTPRAPLAHEDLLYKHGSTAKAPRESSTTVFRSRTLEAPETKARGRSRAAPHSRRTCRSKTTWRAVQRSPFHLTCRHCRQRRLGRSEVALAGESATTPTKPSSFPPSHMSVQPKENPKYKHHGDLLPPFFCETSRDAGIPDPRTVDAEKIIKTGEC